MKSDGGQFYGIRNGNELVIRNSLDEILSIPYLKDYYFERKIHHESNYLSNNGKEVFYHYIPIDRNGKKTKIEIGQFELIEISPDINYYTKFRHREINFFDRSKSITRTYFSKIRGEDFLIKDVVFMINKLSEVPDWDILMQLLSIPLLEQKIQDLERKIIELSNKESS